MPWYARILLVTAPPDEVAGALQGHLDQLAGLAEAGRLRLAGQFREGDGFLEVFEAEDRLAAEAFARSSPLVVRGLGSWSLREFAPWEASEAASE